jgi:uncharacterized protein (DUF58 family)
MPLPARRLVLLAALATAPAALAPFFPLAAALWWIFWLAFGIVAVADAAIRPRLGALVAQRELPTRWPLGRGCEFTLRLHNPGARPLRVRIRDSWPEALDGARDQEPISISAAGSASVQQSAIARARGRHEFGAVHVEAASPLGLWRHRSVLDAPGTVDVYPDWAPGRAALAQAELAAREGQRRMRRRGEGTEFESLREYRPGDALVHLDWKATARRGFPVSRQFQVERNHDLVLALDCGRLMGARFAGVAKLEHALHAVLALAEAGVRQGDRVGFFAFDESTLTWVPPGKGPAQVGAILGAAYALQSRFAETDPRAALEHLSLRQRKSALIVVLTDFLDLEASRPLVEAMLGLRTRHRVLFVAVQDPTFEELLARPASAPADAYAQAVVQAMRGERRVVLETLAQAGIAVLDLPPDRLVAPVINQYLQLRFAAAV